MLVDGIKLLEGSSISNASIETGTAFPTTANMGELFFKTTDDLLYVYNGTVWTAAGSGGTGAASSLTGTTLASNVVSSSLTSVGTLGSLTVTGNVTASDPTTSGHLATKSYVDTAINGLTWKTAVSAASTANLTLSGTQTVDGVALVAGNRVLVKNQTTATQNGIYVVAAGAWTRSTDMDGAPSVGEVNGAAVYVTDGTTFADTAWTQTATITVVGSQAMTFAQFAATGAAAASTLTGTTLASNVLASSLTSVGTLGSLAVTGTHTQTGTINLAGTASPLQVQGSAGTSGQVLTSAGTGATPTWAAPSAAGSALTGTSLASNVVSSSLTSVGILGALQVGSGIPTGAQLASGCTLQVGQGSTGASSADTMIFNSWTTSGNQMRIMFQCVTAGSGGLPAIGGSTNGSLLFGVSSGATAYNGLTNSVFMTLTSSSLNLASGIALAVNGSTGTAGQVLTSSGTGSPTWAAVAGGGASTLTGTTLASNVVTSSITTVGTLASGTKVNSTGTAGASLNVGGSLAVDTNTSSIPLAGTAGALQLGYLNGTVTSTQDAYVAWGGVSAAATLSPGQAGGTLILSARNAGSAGVSIATAGTSRLFVSSTGVTSFKGAYDEQSTAVTATASTTLDLSTANTFTVTLGVSITTLAFSNVPASGRVASVTLVINHSVASTTIAWPASVKWSGGTAPTLTTTAGKTDIVSLMTPDGGTTWYGFVAGLNF